MRKKGLLISAFIMFTLVFFPFSQRICADDMNDAEWRTCLKEFLTEDFPSLFDEDAVTKNEKAFDRYEQWWYYERPDAKNPISQWDVSSDIIIDNNDIPNLYLPYRIELYDMDNDQIPEAVILYGPYIAHGGLWGNVYKLYGTSYEMIGSLRRGDGGEILYINPQNKILSIKMDSIEFLEIKNGELVYSEYVDPHGSKEYDGLKYSEIGWSYEYEIYITYGCTFEEFLGDVKPLPQIDYSDILNEIIPSHSPQTDDAIYVLLLIISVSLITYKSSRTQHTKNK